MKSSILVGTNGFGNLELEHSSKQGWCNNVHWIRAIRLSDDCHSYNVELKLESTTNRKCTFSKLIMQTIRPISVGQELLLWFSEDILALMQMAFLTPANIQGQKRYVCTKCSTLYESPNPLKLHLLLRCGRQSISDLWQKLSRTLNQNNTHVNILQKPISEFTFKLTPTHSIVKQRNAIDLSTTTENKRPVSHPSKITEFNDSKNFESGKSLYRPYSEPPSTYSSAFKPFQKPTVANESFSFTNNLQYWSNFSIDPQIYVNNCTNTAQFQTMNPKWKVLKYGLKIHIRTHTGYKPLKCKFCLRPFGDPSNLNKHVRLHAEGDTPYKCDLCGKILVRRRDLERHLKSRHMSEINPGRGISEDLNIVSETEITDEDTQDLTVDR
ncbi:hypothetical protein FQR65_LT02474 [Abscondita terminalis]|nr:hypothetical protein FQR65_LT02474 [Abscondita terminalis]